MTKIHLAHLARGERGVEDLTYAREQREREHLLEIRSTRELAAPYIGIVTIFQNTHYWFGCCTHAHGALTFFECVHRDVLQARQMRIDQWSREVCLLREGIAIDWATIRRSAQTQQMNTSAGCARMCTILIALVRIIHTLTLENVRKVVNARRCRG